MKDKRLSRISYETRYDRLVDLFDRMLAAYRKQYNDKGESAGFVKIPNKHNPLYGSNSFKSIMEYAISLSDKEATAVRDDLLTIYRLIAVKMLNEKGKVFTYYGHSKDIDGMSKTEVDMNYDMDAIWVFRNSYQFVTKNIDVAPINYNPADVFALNRDILVDMEIDGTKYYIECVKPVQDITMKDGTYKYFTINVMTEKDGEVKLFYSFIVIPEKLPRIYTIRSAEVLPFYCHKCQYEKLIKVRVGSALSSACLIPKFASERCPMRSSKQLNYTDVLNILLYCVECYNNGNKLFEKRTKVSKHYHENEHKVHMAKIMYNIHGKDSYREIPIHHYYYEDTTGNPIEHHEYKGGHHASPVAHDRKAHPRRCANGDIVYKGDGVWEKVPKGTGTHVWVRESHPMSKSEDRQVFKV